MGWLLGAGTLIGVGTGIILTLWRAWILVIMWGWFATPITGISLTMPLAIGLSLLVNIFIVGALNKTPENESTGKQWLNIFLTGVVAPAFALFVGWITHMFM